MMNSIQLTSFALITSLACLAHAGDDHHHSARSAGQAPYTASAGIQTAGLFNIFGSYGTSSRYGTPHTAAYGGSGYRGGYGSGGYGTGHSSRGINGGYGYGSSANQYHSTGYVPSYNRGYQSTGYGSRYEQGYGFGCRVSGLGGGYYGR